VASPAWGQRRPITDRDFSIDLHQGYVLGTAQIIAMGGATVATGDGTAGMMFNPAAAAVRPATKNDEWDWDWNIDWIVPNPGTDHDNNGDSTTEFDDTLVLTGGILGLYKNWALGFGFTVEQHGFATPEGEGQSSATVAKFALARTFFADRLTLGLAVRTGSFAIGRVDPDDGTTTNLFSIGGTSIEAGAIWRPIDRNLRVGATIALPITGKNIDVEECDPLDCEGYILPSRVAVPWQVAAGLGWRFAPTKWNTQVTTRWRDERALQLAADVVVSGAVDEGSGIEAFIDKQIQPSGESVSVSVRAGAEYEWIPGWLRVRAGTYYEPARFDETSGRLHVTGGVELRIYSFCMFNERYRARVAITFDGAARYGNTAFSLGFWH
jgi:hypothetical protein